jgi:hypothetical protein
MDVLGRDSRREAYRVAIGDPEARIEGFVPETVMAGTAPFTGGRGHQAAYDWIARHSAEIELTLRAMASGRGKIRAPFDRLVLKED